jgi:hypothetical protein
VGASPTRQSLAKRTCMVIFPDVYTNNGSAPTCYPLTFAVQIGRPLRLGTGQRVKDA